MRVKGVDCELTAADRLEQENMLCRPPWEKDRKMMK